jgi:hypothetical protein
MTPATPWAGTSSIKPGNIATVQRQLGHTNAAYSIQCARVTDEELAVLEKTRALWSVE